MKTISTIFAVVSMASLATLSAQVTETTEKTETRQNPDGTVTEKHTVTTTTFEPEVQKRVVKYFDSYKGEHYGLPPGWVAKVKVKEIPAAWRTTRLANGVVIREQERPYLMAAPPELVKILPAPGEEVHYYVAGGNVVAVDRDYRVVDSIQIPSIKISVDDE